MARSSRELAQRPAVDPEDEPSVEWGWHGGFRRGTTIAGIVSVLTLLAMVPGDYQSSTQNLWLVGIAAAIALALVAQAIRRRHSWRR